LGRLTLRGNENLGRQIEELVALEIPGVQQPYQCTRGPYDLETATTVIEVKSCRLQTQGMNYKDKKYMQHGRFVVFPTSHTKLLEVATEKAKRAEYLFVLYTFKEDKILILEKKQVTWDNVNGLLMGRKTWKRKRDGQVMTAISFIEIMGPRLPV
jgi:hypothetical protein